MEVHGQSAGMMMKTPEPRELRGCHDERCQPLHAVLVTSLGMSSETYKAAVQAEPSAA